MITLLAGHIDKGLPSDAQDVWLTSLRAAGAEAYLWRPSMWQEISEVLAQ